MKSEHAYCPSASVLTVLKEHSIDNSSLLVIVLLLPFGVQNMKGRPPLSSFCCSNTGNFTELLLAFILGSSFILYHVGFHFSCESLT